MPGTFYSARMSTREWDTLKEKLVAQLFTCHISHDKIASSQDPRTRSSDLVRLSRNNYVRNN